MAKVGLSKLGLSVNKNVEEISWNGQIIEVKQYLPSNEKLEVCSKIINESVDDQNFYNPGRVAIFQAIETLLAYTNINVTEKQQEDVIKFYDLLVSSGFADKIKENIPDKELNYLDEGIWETITEIYRYRDSFMGVMEQTQVSYKDLDQEISDIESKISNPDNLTLLKDVVTKLN